MWYNCVEIVIDASGSTSLSIIALSQQHRLRCHRIQGPNHQYPQVRTVSLVSCPTFLSTVPTHFTHDGTQRGPLATKTASPRLLQVPPRLHVQSDFTSKCRAHPDSVVHAEICQLRLHSNLVYAFKTGVLACTSCLMSFATSTNLLWTVFYFVNEPATNHIGAKTQYCSQGSRTTHSENTTRRALVFGLLPPFVYRAVRWNIRLCCSRILLARHSALCMRIPLDVRGQPIVPHRH